MCVFFLNPWAPEWGQLQCSKRNTLLNTQSNIHEIDSTKPHIIMVMAKSKGLKILFCSSLCFRGTQERPLADGEKGEEYDGGKEGKRN